MLSAFKGFLVASGDKQQTFTAEVSMFAADGRWIQVIISFSLSNSLQGACYILVLMLNVTHQRETEKQLSLVIKGASLGFRDWNLTTSELTVNDRWMEML
ncbi:MAG: hypothetical protein KZQ66_12655 [Candidatus Thiodiazotropha sp. (ex Lucinoma aequizonata)]|nr:hypothetical protein [Candidatus Thiodiazotropha sp. (ex Lucinoma aequizonata)]MCU7888244.1 hypothetical protein [Candidatus Thiodiazotropha sp. (ex Lucinoma aequizonata)]MCU7896180.1 hypothetical protein [Candidatus Thiodiazotropha sp. (ex Lucinoma aequizonata)]MCU7898907.1 hypothetical protein [Candidatus Thiodiazotropha sp. (ex Lucinoma aequizonata)]MCU7902732.1 hypothetical protein [Candidatus Thiodiazotropha sp. (ex Lucinoma aequizonata)]